MADYSTDQKLTATPGPNAPDDKMPQDRDDDDFLVNARKRFNRALVSESDNRKSAIDDLKFKNGEQWPADIRTDRTLQKRPCLTINKMKTFVHQVTNNMRQNRPSINISPVGDGSDKNTANMLKGLIRQIERQSSADIAYDTAFDSAVSNGWGYWRILTEYEDDKTFDQVIKIVPIRNPFRVYLDPDHQMPDGSDAKWGFISDLIQREEFEAEYPDADPVPWDQGGQGDDSFKDWSTQTHVRIAEYFCFETEKKTLLSLADGFNGYEDELPEEAVKLIRTEGGKELIGNEREVEVKKVMWSKITAHQVLEDNEWLGVNIPIIKVAGDIIDIEGRVNYSGLIRDAKDPQRMKNYWATAKTELIALAPKAPWVLEEGQIEGHEQRWQQANQKSYPYLLYKGTSIAGKQSPQPQRQPFAGPPAGVIEAEQSSEQDMMGTTGVRFDGTKSERTNEESGVALQHLRSIGELGSFHYTANFIHSLKYTAEQFIDLIPKVYDRRRVVTILREDDTEDNAVIEPNLKVPFQTAPNKLGKVDKLYNPGMGKYSVAITTGPNFHTKRQESLEGMNNFMKALGPDAARMVAGPMARNMDWPGAEEIAERMDSMLPPQVLQKGLEKQFGDLDPKVKSLIGSMQNQMQQMGQQLQMAGKEVEDKRAQMMLEKEDQDKDYQAKMEALNERWKEALLKVGQARESDDKDFEAKMTKIAADLQMGIQEALTERLAAIEAANLEERNSQRDHSRKLEEHMMTLMTKQSQQEKEPKEPKRETPKLPDIHIHTGGKRKGTIAGKPFEINDE